MRIYNTLTREKEEFVPVQEGRVGIYVCGPTVYGPPHIGHAKTYVAFDVVVRYLRHRGYNVLYVQNITDVGHLTGDTDEGEDKIVQEAMRRGWPPAAVAEHFTREFFHAMEALGVDSPNVSPRATGHVPEMIDLIQHLIATGHAYEADGNVYFDVASFPEYGKLARRELEEQVSSGRIEQASGKRDARDFALWKKAEPEHLMQWNSPWGRGYPGWHIECSAMSMKYLGQTIDIHGAGVDNIFPHNEDEIAQSEAATSHPYVRYWMHNGTVLVNGTKMSKSLGNFTTVPDAIATHGAQVLRYYLVNSHYRSPMDYTDDLVREAAKGRERLVNAVRGADRFLEMPAGADDAAAAESLRAAVSRASEQFHAAMDDDFNSPAALASLFDLATEMNRYTVPATVQGTALADAVRTARGEMVGLAGVLGLDLAPEEAAGDDLAPALVGLLLELRQQARKAKDFAMSDQIRNALNDLGIVVEDRPDGPTWRRA